MLRNAAWSLSLAGMIMAAVLAPSESGSAQAVSYVSIRAIGDPSPLAMGYGLPVVKVPGLPNLELRTTPAHELESPPAVSAVMSQECPFEVRAIVSSPEPGAGFVVLGLPGEESRIAKVKEQMTFGMKLYRLESFESEQITLKRGGRIVRCPLQSRKR